ncbi:TetR/AcrR family transcriptional regulator [Streptomyces sp. Root1310]|uniref:TetR/AcrR family transcriptional regulator n=1 Tax=Streptomyces sp. Root1310 TaxID=1736452 RepID=UPI00070E4075|nr:TetR/AcrR family transcriptional regulator [Streptomyces sp. Root1310]KQX65509.1 TetR family transcriptional regulator [Streptomyces sp. Root1310]
MVRPERNTSQPSLRERKQARTRQALIDAAAELFERQGYDETTVAEIAAAAEIGTRTFFGYFAGKEDILFPDSDARARATIAAIADRDPADGPVDVLLRALDTIAESDADMVSPMAAVRMRLFRTVPAVRGKALQVQLAAQREIARELHVAFPDELDRVSAAALAGALTGAVSGALDALMDEEGTDGADAERLRTRVRQVTELALQPWRQAAGK